jgi:hypothetical protein
MKLRSLVTNVGLLIVSSVVCLGILEIAVRLVLPQQLIEYRPDIFQPADSVGFLFRPDLTTVINTGERDVTLQTDSLGLRIGSAEGTKAPAVRLLLLGDSFMAALQVEYEQSLAGRLDSLLPGISGRAVLVRNAGVPDWGPSQYLVRGRQLLDREPFDLVVVAVFVDNDVVEVRRDYVAPRRPFKIAHFSWPTSLRRDDLVDDYLEQHSQLFILLRTRMRSVLKRAGLSADYVSPEFMRSTADSPRWDVTAGICADIAAAAASHGIPAIFVLVPASFQVDRATFYEYLEGFKIDSSLVDVDQPDRLLSEQLQARGLRVLDALPAFRAAAAGGETLDGTVDRHLSPAGHELLASILVPEIRQVLDSVNSAGHHASDSLARRRR